MAAKKKAKKKVAKKKTAAKKKTTAKKKAAKNVEYVVRSRVKETIASSGLRSSADVADAVNKMVGWYLEQACARAKDNRRGTVRGHDVLAGC